MERACVRSAAASGVIKRADADTAKLAASNGTIRQWRMRRFPRFGGVFFSPQEIDSTRWPMVDPRLREPVERSGRAETIGGSAFDLPLADIAVIYDNSDGHRTLIAERLPKGSLVVHDAGRWAIVERARP